MEKIIIYDTGIPDAGENKIFDREFACKISHTLLPLCHLKEEAAMRGMTLITPDVFLFCPNSFIDKKVFLISHLVNEHTKKIISLGVIPLLLTCQESPFVATRFYIFLKKYSSMFKYSMLFPGMEKMTSKSTNFIPMFFPQSFLHYKISQKPFKNKKFLTYIASNKKSFNLVKLIAIKLLYGWNVNIIYSFRKKIIHFLKHRNDFELYGKGWKTEKSEIIKRVYKGEVRAGGKDEKLQEYKFVLCLENSIFPGYITEKIFDCFFAGSVPLYLGAPDIEKYIPADTFINIKKYSNLEELEREIDSVDEGAYNKYLANIKSFLLSKKFKKFSSQRFTKIVLDLVDNFKTNERF